MNGTTWNRDLSDLRTAAEDVTRAPATADGRMSARQAATCLSGICGLVVRRWGTETMQRTCAELARSQPLGSHTAIGVSEPVQLVAVLARSLVPLAGEQGVRSALAFWASERDPAVWNAVAA